MPDDMRWFETHSGKIAAAVILASFLLSCAIAVHAGPKLQYLDESQYQEMASNLARFHSFMNEGLHPTAWRPPGYIWFLTIPALWNASNTALRLFNVCALAATQLFLFLLAKRIASQSVAAIAVLLSAAYPVLAYTATLLFPQTIGAALFLCGLWLLFDERPSMPRAIGTGVIWGLLILTIPTFIVILAISLVWLAFRRRHFLKWVVAILLPIVLMVGGWSVRNYRALGSFVFVTTNGGVNLLIGNSEHATGTSSSSVDISKYTIQGHRMSEVEAAKFYSRSAKEWMKEHPKRAIELYGAKLVHYFGFSDRTTTSDGSSSFAGEFRRRLIMMATYGPLLILFILRIALAAKYPMSQEEICLAGLYLFNALFASIYFTRIRFRLPMDWLLLVLDAGMIKILADGIVARGRGKVKLRAT